MVHYRSFNQYLRETFGEKVYKLSLDGGFTCPNRDGTIGSRGCIFCSDSGSGDFSVPVCGNMEKAIASAKEALSRKKSGNKYIAYFQNHTNTYGDPEYMRELFFSAISFPEIVGLSVATRPDCLPPEVLDLLKDLVREKPLWVELGLQTIHSSSAEQIRRGYDLPVFDDAIRKLKALGINIVVHMILGLPGETEEMIYETASYIGRSGANGIKFHLLHILKNTDLAKAYEEEPFEVLSLERYTDLIEGCLQRIPPDMVVHRITGDGFKRDLIAPLWSGDKKHVLNYMNRRFEEDALVQGSLYKQKFTTG